MNAASSRRRLAVALVGALVLGGSLIGASRLGTEEGAASPLEPLPSILDGIPQSGAVLGSSKAPVTLVEYKTGGRLQTVPLRSLGPEGIQPAIEAILAS